MTIISERQQKVTYNNLFYVSIELLNGVLNTTNYICMLDVNNAQSQEWPHITDANLGKKNSLLLHKVIFKCLQRSQENLRQWQIRLGVLSGNDENTGYFHQLTYYEPQNLNSGANQKTLIPSLYDEKIVDFTNGLLLEPHPNDITKMKFLRGTNSISIDPLWEAASLPSPFPSVSVRPEAGDIILACQRLSGNSALDLFCSILYEIVYD